MKRIILLTFVMGLVFYGAQKSFAQQPFDITAFPARQEIALSPGET